MRISFFGKMGNRKSKERVGNNALNGRNTLDGMQTSSGSYIMSKENNKEEENSAQNFPFPLEKLYIVHHFMPPNLPLNPKVTEFHMEVCKRTWLAISTAETGRMKRYGKPGIVLFYDEFFYRLIQKDVSMEMIFTSIKMKGEVLVKVIGFFLSLQMTSKEEREDSIDRCRYLGHKHKYFVGVKNHHFAVYAATLVGRY